MANRKFSNARLKRYDTRHVYRNNEQAVKLYGSNEGKLNTFVVVLITVFAMLIAFAGPTTAEEKESGLKEAYMVIADGSKNKAEAEEKLKAYIKKGYPQHMGGKNEFRARCIFENIYDYPKLMLSNEIKGLNPGFWIVVTAIADDRKVADTLSRFIRSLGQASYVRQVWVKRPEEVKLLILDFDKMLYACGETEYQTPVNRWCQRKNQIAKISIQKNLRGFEILHACDSQIPECIGSQSTFNKKKLTVVIPYVFRSDSGNDLYFSPEPSKPSEYLDCGIMFPGQRIKSRRSSSDFSPNQKILRFKKFSLKCFSR